MAYQVSGNRPPMLNKDSDFVKWTVDFIDFISKKENGDLMIQSFSEGPLIIYKREEDFSKEESKRKRADKDALSYLISVLPQHIYTRVQAYRYNPMQLWNALTMQMLGSKIEFKRKEEKEIERKEDSEKIDEITKRLSDLERMIEEERECHKKERMVLVQRVSELEIALNMKEKKENEEKKALELRCRKLSKQNLDFEKVLFFEKEKLEKERVEYEKTRKMFEAKNEKLSNQISELKKDLEKERQELDKESQELEKMKKADFQARCVKDEFSKERKIFRQEIHKLTMNLAALSTDIMKEKRVKSDIQKKLDLVTKERNDLSYKVKSLNKFKHYSECPIRPSNLFYDHSVDNSSKSQSADLPLYKKVNMQWRVKGTSPEKGISKSSVPKKNTNLKAKSFAKPGLFYSANHLIRLAQKNICCSYCGTNDFVHKDYTSFWYGTYHFPSYRAPLNKPGPKTRWVPKST